MGWPQITMIVLLSMELGIHLIKDGERRGDYSFWGALFGLSITVLILYRGHFWA